MSDNLRRVKAEKTQERDELKPYIDKVDELEKKRDQLRHKIAVINKLKENQRGPVRIMDEVSRSLPDLVWLTKLDLNGTRLTLTGMAMDENAVANYISNINGSPFFQEPALKDMARSREDAFSFTLNCNFTYAPPEIKTAANKGGGSQGG